MQPIVAIDPGASGGIAVSANGKVTAVRMPKTDDDIIVFLRSIGPHPEAPSQRFFIEALVKYTGVNMPSSAMATYAGNEAFVRGVLKTLGYKVVQVQPKAWQAAVEMKREKKEPKGQWKNRLKDLAQKIYPDLKVTLLTADALLILHAASQGLI